MSESSDTKTRAPGKMRSAVYPHADMNDLRHPLTIKGLIASNSERAGRSISLACADRELPMLGSWRRCRAPRKRRSAAEIYELFTETEQAGPSHVELGERVLHGKAKIENMIGRARTTS